MKPAKNTKNTKPAPKRTRHKKTLDTKSGHYLNALTGSSISINYLYEKENKKKTAHSQTD